jgi:glycosyltransferase involved in cell wall biosynthesis
MDRKLIYLTHWRFPSEKTMTPLILRTCAHFARRGWEVELWVPRRRNEYKAAEDVFDLYRISPRFALRRLAAVDLVGSLGALGFVLLVLSFNVSAWWRLRKENGAIVYAHDMRDVLLPLLLRKPVFIEIHDFYESSVSFLGRFAFTRAAGLIVTNSHKVEQLHKRYGVPYERMIRQPNAVEAAIFDIPQTQEETRKALGLPEGKIALYTGHLFSWKGVRTLADAAEHLPEDVCVYFVGGTAEDRQAIEAYVAEHQLPRITFVEHQTPDKMPLWMRAADVLVLPNTAKEEASRVETSPVKLFEYLSAAKPIVASDLPSIRDIVTEKEVYFAEPDNGKSFADAIVQALQDGGAKSRAAKELAQQHSWEARAEAIDALLHRFS